MKKINLNTKHFDFPKPNIINNIILSKYSFDKIDIFDDTPCVYVTPKISKLDRNFIQKCLNKKFVFLNENIFSKIENGTISPLEKENILNEIQELSKLGFSISIPLASFPTVFGENEQISKDFALFLYKTKLDIKFLTFPCEYFAVPVWAENYRNTKIYSCQNVTIHPRMLEGLSEKEIVKTIQSYTPSSASTYQSKYYINLKSNRLAQGLEKIIYCCPNCENLVSLYSEFSCVKCKNCGSAFELSPDGKILFTQKFNNFDQVENFQYSALTKKDFDINMIIEYNKITQFFSKNCKKTAKFNVILQIYPEKLIIKNQLTNQNSEIFYEDIENVNYLFNNTLEVIPKNANQFYFQGNNNENLLIIKDLVKINKN